MANVGFMTDKYYFENVKTSRVYINHEHVYLPTGSPYKTILDFRCQCGCKVTLFHLSDVKRNFECPKCGTKDVVHLDKVYKSKQFNATFEITERNGKDFTLKSNRYKALFREEEIVVKTIGIDTIEFKDGRMSITDYRGVSYYQTSSGVSKDVRAWLKRRDIKTRDIIENISTSEDDVKYYYFLYSTFKEKNNGWHRESSLPYALYVDYNNSYVERLYKANIPYGIIKYVKENESSFHVNEKKLHKVFGVPKVAMRLVRNLKSFYYSDKSAINRFIDTVSGNGFNIFMDVYENEVGHSRSDATALLEKLKSLYELGYTNIETLTNYVCRRVKLEQGLNEPVESARLLYDYVRIMKELGFNYEKYPKSLKKVHDIAVMNKNALTKTTQNAKFSEVILEEDYQGLEMKDKIFSVVAPKSSEDLIKEGESLSHCVASYVNDVASKLCKVLFLRFTNELESSYMTIEVRGSEVRQFKGVSNRSASDLDLEFLHKWANKKGLTVRSTL